MSSSLLCNLHFFSVICITLCQDELTNMSFDTENQIQKDNGIYNNQEKEYLNFDYGYCSSVSERYVQSEFRHLHLLLLGFKKIIESPENKALGVPADFHPHNHSEVIFSDYFDGWMLDIFNQFSEINDAVFAVLEAKLLTVNRNMSHTNVKIKHIIRSDDLKIRELNETHVYHCSMKGQVRNWDTISHNKNFQCRQNSESENHTRTNAAIPDTHVLHQLFMDTNKPMIWKVTCKRDTAVMARVYVQFPFHSATTEAKLASGKYAMR